MMKKAMKMAAAAVLSAACLFTVSPISAHAEWIGHTKTNRVYFFDNYVGPQYHGFLYDGTHVTVIGASVSGRTPVVTDYGVSGWVTSDKVLNYTTPEFGFR